jgi:hypothetical protein
MPPLRREKCGFPQRGGGAGAALHFQPFKGHANAYSEFKLMIGWGFQPTAAGLRGLTRARSARFDIMLR